MAPFAEGGSRSGEFCVATPSARAELIRYRRQTWNAGAAANLTGKARIMNRAESRRIRPERYDRQRQKGLRSALQYAL